MLLNDMRCHMRAFALLILAAAASAQFQCGMQLKDGDSITISQQYSAPQGRCTISGPATGSATITSTLADTQAGGTLRTRARAFSAPVTACLTGTQAITLDDEAGGEIVLSGNINIVTRVISAGYSPLCSPASSFITTNGNVTISSGASIRIISDVRISGPVVCAQVSRAFSSHPLHHPCKTTALTLYNTTTPPLTRARSTRASWAMSMPVAPLSTATMAPSSVANRQSTEPLTPTTTNHQIRITTKP
jgi:hypothetical protein